MWHLLKFSCGVLVCGCGAVVACVLCRKWENGKNFTTRTFIRELFNLVLVFYQYQVLVILVPGTVRMEKNLAGLENYKPSL